MEGFARHLLGTLGGLPLILERLNLSQFDAAGFAASRRKDLDAVREANRIVFGGVQALAQKQIEMLAVALSAARTHASAGTFAGTPLEVAARQRELMGKALQAALGHMLESAGIVRNAQSDAFAVVKAQVAADLRDVLNKVQGRAAPAEAPPAPAAPGKAAPKRTSARRSASAEPAPAPAAAKKVAAKRARAKPATTGSTSVNEAAEASSAAKPAAKPAPRAVTRKTAATKAAAPREAAARKPRTAGRRVSGAA